MNLQEIAAADLAVTLEGDGQTLVLTDPSGVSATLKSITNDVSLLIDPGTGALVSGRNVNAALRIDSIRAAGLALPKGVEDGAVTPWLVEHKTIDGQDITTKVLSSNPDRSIGIITLRLELVT